MNPAFLGDSYDLVKRFFCGQVRALGYRIAIDPMFTGAWTGNEEEFFRLIDATPRNMDAASDARTALFLDPDTGVNKLGGRSHVSYERIAREASSYELVFAFDQSFSRQAKPGEVMRIKLEKLHSFGLQSMYYDSHARFLFASKRGQVLNELRTHLVALGLPSSRLLQREV